MVYSLAQYAMMEKEPLAKGIMLGISQEGVIADLFGWRSLDALSETGTRYDDVIQPDWTPIGGSITEDTADGHQISHSVYGLSKHIDIPLPLQDIGGKNLLAKPATQQINLLKKGAAYVVNDTFINGDQGSNPNSFNGLNKIVGNLASGQTVGASQLDISAASNIETAIDRIHVGMHRVEGHMPTAGFGNEQFLLRFESILRQADLLGTDYNWKEAALEVDDPRRSQRSATDKPAFMYRHIPFFDLGVKADQSTQVILNTYTDGGLGSTDNTRVFFVKEGPDDLEGIQAFPMTVAPIGLLEDTDSYRWRFRWILGLAPWGPRCVSKVIGLKVT
jgi:hypothetical protein